MCIYGFTLPNRIASQPVLLPQTKELGFRSLERNLNNKFVIDLNMVPKIITLEEHFISKDITGALDQYNKWSYPVSSKLSSLGDERIKDMDSGGVNLQVISHAPYCATIDECRIGNDELAKACKNNTKRFAAFAMLPMLEPADASVELERCVKQLGFVGALINVRGMSITLP